MILVIGGLASGKRTYLRSIGFGDADMSPELGSACPALVDAQGLVADAPGREGAESADGAADAGIALLADRIARAKEAVAIVEVGSGIVPLDAGERAFRERAGRLARELAERADVVVRMVCGIPVPLKGTLPEGGAE